MLKRIDLTGNPNLGVYISVNEDFAIVPLNLPDDMVNILKEALEVEVIKTSIAGSNLAGALTAGNSNGFLVSPYTDDREINNLKSVGLNVAKLEDKYTAVGNIVAVNDTAAIVSPFISENSVKIIILRLFCNHLKKCIEIYREMENENGYQNTGRKDEVRQLKDVSSDIWG